MKWLNKLNKLAKKNPSLEIMFFVDSDMMAEGEYTKQDIERIEIDYYYCDDERYLIGEDEIIEFFVNGCDYSEEEIEEQAKKAFEENKKKAIFVYLSS